MNWKFWQKKENEGTLKAKVVKLPKPKELPDRVGIYLITQLHENPDWVWKLSYVARPKHEDKHVLEIRIFDAADAEMREISVSDYNFLDARPELILFNGIFDKSSGTVKISKRLRKVA
jgi:hypothetical protein